MTEPNNTLETATSLGQINGLTTIEDSIFNGFGTIDVDFFSFELTEVGESTDYISVNDSSYFTFITLSLYDNEGQALTTGTQSFLTGLTPGTYYVKVYDSYNGGGLAPGDFANYTLTINIDQPINNTTKPDLIPYQPDGWDEEIVISTVTGTNTDAATITTDDSIYIDWANINQGDAATGDVFNDRLLLNGTELGSWFVDPPLEPNDWRFVEDYLLSPLSAGTYTLTLEVDYLNAIAEATLLQQGGDCYYGPL